eukprot:14178553-Alexandrium_andersonii.AAC.1
MDDPQVALRLLRQCASYAKVVHSMRTAPPDSHDKALQVFDGNVRRAFAAMSGLPLGDAEWEQATLSLRRAGL